MADTCMAPTARSAALTTLTSVLLLRTNSNAVRDTRTKSRHPDEPRWPTMTPRGSFGSLLKSAISSGCDDKGCDMHECKSLIRHIQQPVLHQAAPDPLLQASCLNLGPDQSLAFFSALSLATAFCTKLTMFDMSLVCKAGQRAPGRVGPEGTAKEGGPGGISTQALGA